MFSLLKDNARVYWQLFKGIGTVTRVMMFEQFSPVFLVLYSLITLTLMLMFFWAHWGLSLAVFIVSIVLYNFSLQNSGFLKRMLIFKDDRIEYVDPLQDETLTSFIKAVVVLKMKEEEVRKTKLISDELIEGNVHFYLVKQGKEAKVIAFDWIMGLSPELLDHDFL